MEPKFIKPLDVGIKELINNLGIKAKLQEYEAVTQWEEIVGRQIAAVSIAKKIAKGVLVVQVKTSVWRNELLLRKKEIIDRLNSTLGHEVVKDIKFQ